MATKTQVTVLCDRPHDQEVPGVETVQFGYAGTSYEIDLCDDDVSKFQLAIGQWAGSARRVTPPAPRRAAAPSETRTAARRGHSAAIRAWAHKRHGETNDPQFRISDKGRIPRAIEAAYYAARARSDAL